VLIQVRTCRDDKIASYAFAIGRSKKNDPAVIEDE